MYLLQLIETFSPKLLFLQEIWVPYSEEDNINLRLQEYTIQISTPDQFTPPEDKLCSSGHTWHGAAIVWHASLNSYVTNISNTHDRFTGIKIDFQGQSILAVSAYLPTSGQDDEFLECLSELSNFILVNNSDNRTILIGLDANCSLKSTARRISGFSDFCDENNLLKICVSEPTFHHNNGLSNSNIDFFLISNKNSTKLINIFSQCNQQHLENFSSHDPVLSTLLVACSGKTKSESYYSHTYTEFTRSRVVWDEANIDNYQTVAAQILQEYESFLPTPEFIPLKCQLYSELLVKSAEICLDSKPVRKGCKSRPSPQVNQAWKHLQKCIKLWKKSGKKRDKTDILFVKYKQARADFQRVRRYQYNLKTIRSNNQLMQSHFSDRNKHFKLIKQLRGQHTQKTLTMLDTPAGQYHGSDTLEGFAKDAELLGCFVGESSEFDNHFYRLCVQDNQFIFDFKDDTYMKIPKMKYEDLEKIINKEMKKGKACDIYRLTTEHLKHAGEKAKLVILNLINDIIGNIYYLSCSQVKAGLGTAVYKGRKKPVSLSSSYRRITVTPQIGSILDRYIDPIAEDIFLRVQSADQYGFTYPTSWLLFCVVSARGGPWTQSRPALVSALMGKLPSHL